MEENEGSSSADNGGGAESAPPAEDRIKNLQAEFGRKFNNLEETNKRLLETLD